jgi:hypothetical protein
MEKMIKLPFVIGQNPMFPMAHRVMAHFFKDTLPIGGSSDASTAWPNGSTSLMSLFVCGI